MPHWPGLMERTRDELHERGIPIRGPVVVAPFVLVGIAAERDVERDLSDRASATAEVREQLGDDVGEMWGLFLDDVSGSSNARRRDEVRTALLGLEDASQLREAFTRYPELRAPAAVEVMEGWRDNAEADEERSVAEAHLELLRSAQAGDLDAAWEQHLRRIGELDLVRPRVESLLEDSDPASGRWEDIHRAALELRDLARTIQDDGLRAEACSRAATALFEVGAPGRPANLEQAVDLLEEALVLTPETEADREDLGRLLLNLGAAVAGRFEGDPLANQERAVDHLRRSIVLLSIDGDGRAWAMAQTNLGLSLLEIAKYRPGGADQPAPELLEAIRHFEEAFRWRTFNRNPLDWAHTQINLALALRRRPGRDRTRFLREAVHHNGEAIRGFEAADRPDLAAQALLNRGNAFHALGRLSGDQEERQRLVEVGIADTRRAIDRTPTGTIDAGRAWKQLGDLLVSDGYSGELVEAYRAALDTITPTTSPRDCREAAGRLADLASGAGDWQVAAQAGEIAARAAASAVEARATGAGRSEETATNLNLSRSAAYALVRAGRPERAIEVLELGRARELARWLQRDADLERVRELDPELADRFESGRQRRDAIERLARSGETTPIDQTAAGIEDLGATIAAVRELPGLSRFLEEPDFGEIAAGASKTSLLAYPVTTPYGSLWLIVRRGGEPSVEAVDVPDLNSAQIVIPLLRPDSRRPDGLAGYLAAQDPSDLDLALDELADLLGPRLLRPLAEALHAARAVEVCIIPMGLLGRVPLHTLGWEEDGRAVCLSDTFVVTFAPSAFSRSVCAARAERQSTVSSLLIVGNPLPHSDPLDGTGFEAALVASTVTASEVDQLVETAATKMAVRNALPRRSHIHLACHGRGTQGEAHELDCGLSFAHDEWLTGSEILELEDFEPRLVVASACETGVIPSYEQADEALALSTVLIGAGAAGVVASLWPVDDHATALLMSRFYELLEQDASSPPEALREAQLWLRDLTNDDERQYVATRNALRSHLNEDRRRGSVTGGARRFAATRLWGGFAFSGA